MTSQRLQKNEPHSGSLTNQATTYLIRRGIPPAIAEELGWYSSTHHGRPVLVIPIEDAGGQRNRLRFIDGHPGRKTIWEGPPGSYTPKYYCHPAIAQSISAANGHLIIAAGEMDLATFHAIGWPNIICFTSEMAVPHDLAETLHGWRGTEVSYWPDNDDTGRQSARKIRDQLTATGITFKAYDLDRVVREKGDTNDLWQTVQFDRDMFIATLNACEPLTLPRETRPQQQQPPDYRARHSDDEYQRWWTTEVLPAVERCAGSQRGKHFRCINPDHEDRNPSARISTDKDPHGIYICTCGIPTRDQVASWAGAPLYREWLQDHQVTALTTRMTHASSIHLDDPQSTHPWWQHGTPDGLRLNLLRFFPRNAAFATEALIDCARSGRLDLAHFTLAEALEALQTLEITLSEQSLRRTLNDPNGLGAGVFIRSVQGSSSETLVYKTEKNLGGRPKIVYSMAQKDQVINTVYEMATRQLYARYHRVTRYGEKGTLAPITARMLSETGIEDADRKAAALQKLLEPFYHRQFEWRTGKQRAQWWSGKVGKELQNPHSTPLESGWKLDSHNSYQALVVRSLHKAEGETTTWSRRKWCNHYGISNGKLNAILALAGIESTERPSEVVEIPPSRDFQRDMTRQGQQIQGYPIAIFSGDRQGRSQRNYHRGEVLENFVGEARALGHLIYVEYKVSNQQRIVDRPLEVPGSAAVPSVQSSSESAQKREAQSQTLSLHRPRYARQYGPQFQREWVRAQLLRVVWMLKCTWASDERSLTAVSTGEIIRLDAPIAELVDIVLSLDPNDFQRVIRTRESDLWRNPPERPIPASVPSEVEDLVPVR